MQFSQDQLELMQVVYTNEVARLTKLVATGENLYRDLAVERINMLKDMLAKVEAELKAVV